MKEVTLLLFFFMHEGLECSNMSVASAAWLVIQPIIFVSYDLTKGSISNQSSNAKRCFKKCENKIKFLKVNQP